ncbi:uncharacterized protein STEHIDRAFT_164816 [Stereum hirsutum FP-91666 SS1]|uniref:uncharacterized protein n=1 Tax=Stereum hirsutum (strain FP-91666) TaxID=721885 RepID=UPI000440E867|nr:uncharacterized protein STEHIDRAFT_164816 [Stereum hirsutum FP-91666 SS1]EIM92560.1 hypothetical protein STEHIDRAFT_164816 [Stereum hirsutum FP-91666 SS1]
MFCTTLSAAAILTIFLTIQLVHADTNTTVDDDNPSISYTNGASGAIPCEVDDNGQLIGGQAGCFNTLPHNCTDHFGWSKGEGNGASLKFNGTAIIVSALLDDGSNLFNITLDGVTTSVDGARLSGPFLCDTLFSQSGLDGTKEHEISVIIGGPSPTANSTLQDSSQWSLLLDNFIVTESDGTAGGNSSVVSASSTASTAASTSSSSMQSSKASQAVAHCVLVLIVMLVAGALSI